jgi:hypothetical protein
MEQQAADQATIDSTAEEIPANAVTPPEEPEVEAEAPPEAVPAAAPAELVTYARPEGSTALIVAANAADKIAIATEIATQLDAVIKAQGLRTKIGRRKKVGPDGSEKWEDAFHVNVEGWQTLGTFLDLAVVPLEPTPVIDPETGRTKITEYEVERFVYPKGTKKQAIKDGSADVEAVERAVIRGFDWRCRTEVYKDGTLIAAATAMVSRGEESWRSRDEHALASMAQTRSIGKAIAGAARWIVALAGYSTTPAEEMPAGTNGNGHAEEPAAAAAIPWAVEASAELAQLAKRALVDVLGGDKEAAAIVWKSITETPPTGSTEPIGHCPQLVGQTIVRIATQVQRQRKAREQDAAAEAPDRPAEEKPAAGTVEDTPENREKWCTCPDPDNAEIGPAESGRYEDNCPIKNHGIPF